MGENGHARGVTVVIEAAGRFGPRVRRAVTPSAERLVVLADAGASPAGSVDGDHLDLDLANLVELDAALASIAERDPIDALVVVALPEPVHACSITDLDDDAWETTCERPLRVATHALQAAYRHLAASRGAVVFVCPTLGLQGAAGFTAVAALSEGQRVLAKSVARQWAVDGISVNVLAPPLTVLFDESTIEDAAVRDARRGRIPGDGSYDVDDAMSTVLGFLVSPASHALVGVTLPVDSGQVTAL